MLRAVRFFVLFWVPLGIFPQASRTVDGLEGALRKSGLRVSVSQDRPRNSREYRLGLQTAQQTVSARLIQRTDRSGQPPKQRSTEVSAGHFVVAFLDADGTIRHWQIVIDPRIIRGEFPDDSGHMRKTVLYRDEAEISVASPDGFDAAEIRIFKPAWESGELTLAPLASLRMGTGERQ